MQNQEVLDQMEREDAAVVRRLREKAAREQEDYEQKQKAAYEAERQENLTKYGYDIDKGGCWECGRKGFCGCWG